MSRPRPLRARWRSQLYDPNVKLTMRAIVVGACLAEYVNGSGVAWPSATGLGERVNLDERTVRRGFDELTEAGLLVVERQPGRRSIYRLQMLDQPRQL